MSGPGPSYFDAATILDAVPPGDAVRAVEEALRGGLDPAADVPRVAVAVRHGELLLMPAQTANHVGVKLATVAPDNPSSGLPRVNAVYVLFDGATLRPRAVLDGAALTRLRTPATSVAAVRPWLIRLEQPLRLVVFGAGPQGVGHVETIAALHEVGSLDLVVRRPDRVHPSAWAVDGPVRVLVAGGADVERALGRADVVVCATTARTALFDTNLLGERAVLIAVGSHEPEAREVDAAFCARATVVVEDVPTALRECGDVMQAVAEGAVDPASLVPMSEVVRGLVAPKSAPVFFKGSGMSWQDLVVAEAVLQRLSQTP